MFSGRFFSTWLLVCYYISINIFYKLVNMMIVLNLSDDGAMSVIFCKSLGHLFTFFFEESRARGGGGSSPT